MNKSAIPSFSHNTAAAQNAILAARLWRCAAKTGLILSGAAAHHTTGTNARYCGAAGAHA